MMSTIVKGLAVAAMVGMSALSLSAPAEAGHDWGPAWGGHWHGGGWGGAAQAIGAPALSA